MKKVTEIILTFLFLLIVLTGCVKTDETVADVTPTGYTSLLEKELLTDDVVAVEEQDDYSGQGGYETAGSVAVYSDEFAEAETAVLQVPEELFYTVYRIREGDMIGYLAEEYGVTQDTLISVNSIKQTRYIQPGDYIRIPNIPGIVYTVKEDGESVETIAAKYEVDAERCARLNSLSLTDGMTAGTTLFVPDAELDWVTRQEINGDLFSRPIKAYYYISSYFGWRESPFTGARSYHSGMDLACPSGTKIYAALAGVVTTVGYNDTYGYHVIITHHSGYKTLYGHMLEASKLKVGQHVTTDTLVGKVGSTGLSTGPHLHFTVYKNNVAVNPAALWR